MDIIVLVKQVPATESLIQIGDDGKSVKLDNVKMVISPYDEFAVEEALRIREAAGGTVTILCLGPEKAVDTIRTALAMGADKGVLITDPAIKYADGLTTAKILAAALKGMAYDLIIAGQRAVDDNLFQVGPAVAELLQIPNLSNVIKQEIADGKITCHSTAEGGTNIIQANLPMLFTTQRGLNEPRYVSMPGIMKAKKKPIEKKSLADIGCDGLEDAKVQITGMKLTTTKRKKSIVTGENVKEKAAKLVAELFDTEKVM